MHALKWGDSLGPQAQRAGEHGQMTHGEAGLEGLHPLEGNLTNWLTNSLTHSLTNLLTNLG